MGASNPTYAELDCRQRTPKLELNMLEAPAKQPAGDDARGTIRSYLP